MGPPGDVRVLQQQGRTYGGYNGAASPSVPGLRYSGYTAPPSWKNPQVGSQDLMVSPNVLKSSATEVDGMANSLQTALARWQGQAQPANGPQVVGDWSQARQLGTAITKSYNAFSQFVGDLLAAHTAVASKLDTSADHYNSAEAANVAAIQRAAGMPSATIIDSGGTDEPVDPGYGTKLTPQQQAALQHLVENNGPSETWTKTDNITADAPFSNPHQSVTSQQLLQLMAETSPELITDAGKAYSVLSDSLTTAAAKLGQSANTLAQNWSGTSAVAAISQLQQMYQTAADLQANAYQAGVALTWYGQVLAAYRNSVPTPAKVPPGLPPAAAPVQAQANEQAANNAAQQFFDSLNTHIGTAYNTLPVAVNQNLPSRSAAPAPPAPEDPGGTVPGGPGVGPGDPAANGTSGSVTIPKPVPASARGPADPAANGTSGSVTIPKPAT